MLAQPVVLRYHSSNWPEISLRSFAKFAVKKKEKNMLAVKVHNLSLKNPVLTASGTFGYGEEFADFIDLNRLGGFVVKGTTGTHREGLGHAQQRRPSKWRRGEVLLRGIS